MLLRFSVSNYLSILDEQELSMVAGNRKTVKGAYRIPLGDLNILPSAVIYGPNASGKSNLISALRFLSNSVLHSHAQRTPESGVPRIPFAFDQDALEQPTTVDVDFVIEGVRYQFGFEADNNRFLSEWLFAFPEGKRRKLYERKESDVTFGPSMKGQKKILIDLMRPNSLFLSTATQNDHEELTRVRKFFLNVSFNSDIAVENATVDFTFSNEDIDPRTISFLSRVGTGVTGYRRRDEEWSDSAKSIHREMLDMFRRYALKDSEDADSFDLSVPTAKIELAHRARDGADCYLSLTRESAGTRRLLLLMSKVFKAIDAGNLIVIDEIDASLHTFAVESIIALFDDPEINSKGAQLLATVHDTNLLASEFLERDQVWFAEKNEAGESEFFSLSEIRSRPADNFELGYLQGRYGAMIPKPRRNQISRLVKK